MQEIELKFQIPPRGRDALASTVDEDGAVRAVRLQARYFDTPARDLAGAAFALRLRHEADGWVQTLKGRGDGMMRRLEHNAPVDLPSRADTQAVPALSLGRHAGTPAGIALAALLARQGLSEPDLKLQFSTDITRLSRELEAEGARVELALDMGTIESAGASLPVHEIEFELLEGSAHGLLAQSYLWVEAFGLWLDVRSKAERGDRLARGETVAPVPEIVVLPEDAPFGARVAALLRPVLALAAEVADEQATPAHQVALTRGMSDLAGLLREAGVEPWLCDTATLLAGLAFEPGAWRLADTQRLWLALIGFTLPEEDAAS
jgi:inorganic triphosphatase YgiF